MKGRGTSEICSNFYVFSESNNLCLLAILSWTLNIKL